MSGAGREVRIELSGPIAEGELIEAGPRERRLLVTRIDGELYAVDLWCTHEQVNLAGGSLIDGEVFCPRHFSSFDVKTGKVTGPPATQSLGSYPVREEAGEVFVTFPD